MVTIMVAKKLRADEEGRRGSLIVWMSESVTGRWHERLEP